MKKIYLFFGILLYGIYFSQVKINNRNDIEIYLMDPEVSMERYLDAKRPYQYKIINHTNDDYIIDPQGFRGKTDLYECNQLYTIPEKIIPEGYYDRDDPEDCQQDLIIVKKQSSIITSLYILNISFFYNIEATKSYYLKIRSKHNKNTATILGCSNYINNLEKQGYKILDDNIDAKLWLVP